jgi:transketolase
MGVFQPMDARETELVMNYLVEKWKGPAYLRLTRQNLPDLMTGGEKIGSRWEAGKIFKVAEALSGKKKIVVFATGAGTAEAMKAAEILDKSNSAFSLSVYNVHSLKPFDEVGTLAAITGADLVITVEDHSVIGGLGSCVAETLAKSDRHPRLIKYGVQDKFGESGEPDELYDLHGISGKAIAASLSQ